MTSGEGIYAEARDYIPELPAPSHVSGGGEGELTVLWVTNIPLTEATNALSDVLNPYGGWLSGAASGLASFGSTKLHVAFPWKGPAQSFRGALASYHTIPVTGRLSFRRRSPDDHRDRVASIIRTVKPNLIHIWGTEMAHCLPAAEAARSEGVEFVVSIQGLAGVVGRHLLNGLPTHLQTRYSIHDVVRPTSSRSRAELFSRRGKDEMALLSMTHHVIGRTTWDRACVLLHNPQVQYHHCDEILRQSFWSAEKAPRQPDSATVFMAQGTPEYKGLHIALEGLRLLRKKLPATLVVAGPDPTTTRSPYGAHLRRILGQPDLRGAVRFTGNLDEGQMLSQMRSSDAYVLSSSIENSPNSLCEAMTLGLPCVASFVGGVPDLLTHGVDGLMYPADAPYMLAHHLGEIFRDPQLADRLGANARTRAMKRHDPVACTRELVSIYQRILRDADDGPAATRTS